MRINASMLSHRFTRSALTRFWPFTKFISRRLDSAGRSFVNTSSTDNRHIVSHVTREHAPDGICRTSAELLTLRQIFTQPVYPRGDDPQACISGSWLPSLRDVRRGRCARSSSGLSAPQSPMATQRTKKCEADCKIYEA